MNWATLIYIAVMLGLCYVFYLFGGKNEKSKRDKQFKRDVDVYLERQKVVDSFKRDVYSDDDIMSGKPLTDENPPSEQTNVQGS